ncbi:MAG: thiolase family protein [Planctomycetes bacterium]|jgi:acetyl-CoA C-acetyltransferase|nr:thiolase family protein [Planctomycetota bacterium]
MERIAIAAAARTPIGKFQGGLSPLSAVDLGAAATTAALQRAGVVPNEVEELLFGQARQLGSGPNPARQVAIKAGCGDGCVASTINKACGSSLKAIDLARAAILLDGRQVVVAGGMESMTNIPFLLPNFRQGYRLGHVEVKDGNFQDGFTCGILGEPMGMTAEYLADEYHVGRAEQDEFALQSHQRGEAAQQAGRFATEIAPITIAGKKGPTVIAVDEHVRPGVTIADLQKLPPVFRPKVGTVHAGNSSGITDGAAALVLMPESELRRRRLEPLAWLGASATAGVPPRIMGIGPVPAVRTLLQKNGRRLDDYDLVELNEAFAAQMLACLKDLPIARDRLNVNGGAIALGHPIGATGARIVVTLLHELARRGGKRGLATLCMSGGMGMALEFER